MEYKDLNNVRQAFVAGKIPFPDTFTVAGIIFRYRGSSTYDFNDMIHNNKLGFIIYTCGINNKEKAEKVGLMPWLLFAWKFQDSFMKPYAVEPTRQALKPHTERLIQRNNGATTESVVIEMEGETRSVPVNSILGDVANVTFTSLMNSPTIKGLVDTGATLCSLHADEWNKNGDTVEFSSSELSENTISLPIVDHQSISSADGGVEYRPVVEMNIKINDKQLTKVLFNLNDRNSMEYPLLIGQNALEQGKFLIDPTINESDDIDWENIENINLTPIHIDNILEDGSQHETEFFQEMLIKFDDFLQNIDKKT